MEIEKNKIVHFSINGKKVEVPKGSTILQASKIVGIVIPTLCAHPDCEPQSNCRICLVEVDGARDLKAACSTKVEEGMIVKTSSEKINAIRKTLIELLFSQHTEECNDCVAEEHCKLLRLAREYHADMGKYSDRKKTRPICQWGSVVFDQTKCIDCKTCVAVCPTKFLESKNYGADSEILPSKDPKKDCVQCGQCITHCPVGAIEAVGEYERLGEFLDAKKEGKVFVAQFAPATRVSIGEEFGMSAGSVVEGRLVAALKKLGFDFVFDTSFAADVTTIEEANELIERIKAQDKDELPMFTSCCPGWVNYLEFNHPELIKNLTTVRSPHIILGGIVKSFVARNEGLKPEDVVMVSVMPCIAKKGEAAREELKIEGLKPVDYVLTTRELVELFRRKKIDLANITPQEADKPLGSYSGAGVIYGTTGGVMESALRTAYKKLTGRELASLELTSVRGLDGLKRAEIKIGDLKVTVGVINGLINIEKLLKQLRQDPHSYDYIEVMACRGGCIGGGGQPLPINDEVRKKRMEALYGIDFVKKVRTAHSNIDVLDLYKKFFTDQSIIKNICYTHFSPREKTKIDFLRDSEKTYEQ